MPMAAKRRIAIVGAGQAGLQAAQSLRQAGFDGDLTLVGDEPQAPYQRPPLSKAYLSNEIDADRLELKPTAFFSENHVTCLFGVGVQRLDARDNRLSLTDGSMLEYDMVLLTTGSRPRDLPVDGGDLDGVVTLRTVGDVDAMRPMINDGNRAIIVGGGYIGLEVAASLRKLGLHVTVLEAFDRVMARATSEVVSRHYQAMHRKHGVDVALGAGVQRIEKNAHGLKVHTDQAAYEADLVLVGVGAQPNQELAEAAGLKVDNGIVVDTMCRTAAPNVFAAGDCCSFPSPRYGRSVRLESVQNAIDQAKAAAMSMLGKGEAYDPVPWFWSDQYDAKLQIAGLSQDADEQVVRGDIEGGAFSVAYVKQDRLIAIDAVNVSKDYMMARRLAPTDHVVDRSALADPTIPIAKAVATR